MKAALFLALAFAAVSAHAGALGELCRQSEGADCDAPRDFIHPAGWIVDASCLQDKRFTAAEFRAALDEAARKFSPGVPVSKGGCLADYNPSWAKEIVTFLHADPVRITCPSYDPKSHFCADHMKIDGSGGLIRILNIGPCLDEKGTGLAGTLFHETLHAVGADNLPLEKHNAAWDLPQYVFVTDRVYGTEALCFLGTKPETRKLVNVLQCHAAVNYENERPDRALCSGFNTVFYDTVPPGTSK